jgi:hypothetical protein
MRKIRSIFVLLVGGRSSPAKLGETAMTIKTNVKAGSGGLATNHSESLTVKTNVKAGALTQNHNETLAVRSNVKAGRVTANHNESFRR